MKKLKMNQNNLIFNIIVKIFMFVFSLTFILPLMIIISVSLSTQENIDQYGFSVFPRAIDFSAYNFVFENPQDIITAYKVSIIVSVISLILYMLMSSTCAYALSKKDFKYRNVISFYLFFTMLFGGGLAPTYILMTKYLRLQDTYAALIIPLLGNVWHMFIIRTYFQNLPESLCESAEIDGASELQIYSKIMLPLSKPVLATVGVMSLLIFWGSWMPALLYINKKAMYPLQYLLQSMLRNVEQIILDMNNSPDLLTMDEIPTEPVRMALCIVVAGPMLLIFPFFQKYFIKGMTVGSVKG